MKKSKQSFQWNKVTPLSKYLAMVLFVALPFIGFILGMKYQLQNSYLTSTISQNLSGDKINPATFPTSPTNPILAETITGFDFTDSYTIALNSSLRFTINKPQKAVGTVIIQEDLCTNGINTPQVIAIKHLDGQNYWCNDTSFFKQFIGTDDPASFILQVNVSNSKYEDQQLNSNDYFKAYYFDLNSKKWKQGISMTSSLLSLKSKSNKDLLIGFGIPTQAEKIILVTGKFGQNSVIKDSVQHCYLMDFSQKQASRTSCNVVW